MKLLPVRSISLPAFEVAGVSDIGCIRTENQDAWLADESLKLAVVADGMGGRPAGAQAAQIVTRRVTDLLRERTSKTGWGSVPQVRDAQQLLRETLLSVSNEILGASEDDPKLKGMGATVVAAWRCGAVLLIAHQGDSRAYLFRNNSLRTLTADHSIVALLVRNKEITEEEAATHPARGQLTRFMGMQGDVYCEVHTLDIEEGDRLLLCTDGLWGVVNNDEIVAALLEHQQPASVCSDLVEQAIQRGAPDNVTAVVWNLGGVL